MFLSKLLSHTHTHIHAQFLLRGIFFSPLLFFLLQPNRWMLIGSLWLDADAEAGCSCNRLLCLVGTVIRAFDAKSHPRTPTRPKGYKEWHRTTEKQQQQQKKDTKYARKMAARRKNRKFSNSFDLVTTWSRNFKRGKEVRVRKGGKEKKRARGGRRRGLELHV